MDLPKKYKAGELEDRWQKYWTDKGVYTWDPDRPRNETFVVDTPPPTVSGSLHVGHMFSYSHQDFIVRYQRMTGKNIYFPIGWDDNGLPTERRVQNLYNVKCEPHLHYDPDFKAERGKKGDPQPISRKNFIELCDVATREVSSKCPVASALRTGKRWTPMPPSPTQRKPSPKGRLNVVPPM